MNDQPYGDARREFDYFEPRPAAPVPPWNSRAYDPVLPTTDEEN